MIDHPRFGKIPSIVMLKDGMAGEELFCDYGYIDKFIQTEHAIHTLYQMGRWLTNKTDQDYHKDVKSHITYIKHKVNSIKPYMEILKDFFK